MRHFNFVPVLALTAGLLSACGGGGGGDSDGAATQQPANNQPSAPAGMRRISGAATKGPMRGANVTIVQVNCSECGIEAQTVTDSFGNFTADISSSGRFRAIVSDGSFIDESDPAPVKRSIDMTEQSLGDVILPDDANTVAYNLLTLAVQQGAERIRNESFNQCEGAPVPLTVAFDALVDQVSAAFDFDVLTTLPQGDPTNPSGGTTHKQYSMALGGIAQAVNEVAVRTGRPFMNVDVIAAIIDDLSDGVLDGREDGLQLTLPDGPDPDTLDENVPNDLLSLNAQIARFKNNNANAYTGVTLLVIDENILTTETNVGPGAGNEFQSVSISAGGGVDVLFADANPCDREGDTPIDGVLADPPTHGNVTAQPGKFVYTHDGGPDIFDQLTYKLRDSLGNLGESVTIQIFIDQGTLDSDGDGFNNNDEASFGTNPLDPDTDNDDVNDFLEVNAGSDPLTAESGNVFYLRPFGAGSGLSWADAADSIADANSWLNSRPSAGIFYLLFAEDAGYNYGAPLFVGDQVSPGIGVPPFSVVVAVGGLDPAAPANQQGLYQPQGSLLDGGADCSDGVPAGSGQLVSVEQEQLSNLGLIGLKLVNGRVTGGNNGGGIQTIAAPSGCGSSCPVLVLTDTKIGSSCSQNFGGGVYAADNWRLELYNSEISANNARRGGGIYGALDSSISIFDSVLDGNVADEAGGAVASTLGNLVDIADTSFRQNLVFSSTSAGCEGGALYHEGDTGDLLQIQNALFSSNEVFCTMTVVPHHGGGAVFARGQDLPGFTGFGVTIHDSRFLSNDCLGGALECNGGALNLSLVAGEIVNNLIVGNVANGRGGGLTTHDNGGFFDVQLNTIAYNQAFDQAPIGGVDPGGGYFGEHNAATSSKNNIMFFNDNGTVSPVHASGEDCEQRLVFISSSNDTIGSQTCTSGPVSLLSTDPQFKGPFYLDQASASVNSGSESDAASFFCALIGGCPPDHSFTTNITGAPDAGVLDRGFHHNAPAEAQADGALAAPGQNNNVSPNCGLTYGFNLTTGGGFGPDLSEGHKVGVCIADTVPTQAADFQLTGQGTLDPVNYDGTTPTGCAERAVLATDSGINGVYSLSVDVENAGGAGGPHNIVLRLFVDDGASFTHTISGATFGALCGSL